ncbi:MAG: hypothetical protein J5993_01250 [Clostridia bacterium]|nr:hypothetical protein [Clostridia bacterium]
MKGILKKAFVSIAMALAVFLFVGCEGAKKECGYDTFLRSGEVSDFSVTLESWMYDSEMNGFKPDADLYTWQKEVVELLRTYDLSFETPYTDREEIAKHLGSDGLLIYKSVGNEANAYARICSNGSVCFFEGDAVYFSTTTVDYAPFDQIVTDFYNSAVVK